jgi:hypothetical protein
MVKYKFMKRAIILVTVLFSMCGISRGAEPLFAPGEINFLGYGTYVDRQDNHWGAGIGLNYFMTQIVGFGVSSHMENLNGSVIDNLLGEVYLRFPLGESRWAPYAIGSGGYNFEESIWQGGGGAGVEFRVHKSFGLFGDVQWVVYEGSKHPDGVEVRAGFRIGL